MLNNVFDPGRIKLNLEGTTKNDVFGELIETIAGANSEFDRQELLEAIIMRESKMNTLILPGIAVPHGYCSTVHGIIGAIGFSRRGVEYDNLDQSPVHLFFLLLMDQSSREQHLKVLNRLLELLKSTTFARIEELETPQDVYNFICHY